MSEEGREEGGFGEGVSDSDDSSPSWPIYRRYFTTLWGFSGLLWQNFYHMDFGEITEPLTVFTFP